MGWAYVGETAMSPCRKLRATILQRHHFSSVLRRSSVLVRVEDDGYGGRMPRAGGSDSNGTRHAVLAKGAPEVIRDLLRELTDWLCGRLG